MKKLTIHKAISIHENYFVNHNLSNPLFLIFISSVLYFIKKINNENSANAAVINSQRYNIDGMYRVFDKILLMNFDAMLTTNQQKILL